MESVEIEIWKPVIDYEGLYEVSSRGKVRSLGRTSECVNGVRIPKPAKMLKLAKLIRGRQGCTLYDKNGKGRQFQVHILVAKSFVAGWKTGYQVNHKDKDPSNNYVDNLEWVSGRENQTHRFITTKTLSEYPGVSYKKDGQRQKRWYASVSFEGRTEFFGIYKTEREAYDAYLKGCDLLGIINKYAM